MNQIKNYKVYDIFNKIIVLLMTIISTILGIYYIKINEPVRVFSSFSIFLTLLIPILLNKTKYRLNIKELFIYNSFMFLSHFIGSIINVFNMVSWYDTFVHFLSGIFTFYISYIILIKTKCAKNINPLIIFIYFMGFTSFVAVCWEIIEYIGDVLLKTNFQHNLDTGVSDTMIDMIVAVVGSFISYIYLFFVKNKKNI